MCSQPIHDEVASLERTERNDERERERERKSKMRGGGGKPVKETRAMFKKIWQRARFVRSSRGCHTNVSACGAKGLGNSISRCGACGRPLVLTLDSCWEPGKYKVEKFNVVVHALLRTEVLHVSIMCVSTKKPLSRWLR